MTRKNIVLAGKCGSCCHFKTIGDTAAGECLQKPYNDSVVHDPKHPHWIVQRSRIKCPLYNAKPQTNADRIRAMNDEELAVWMTSIRLDTINEMCKKFDVEIEMPTPTFENTADVCEWLKQPAEGE